MTFIYFPFLTLFIQLFLDFSFFLSSLLCVCVCFALNNRLLRVPVLQANISSLIKTFFLLLLIYIFFVCFTLSVRARLCVVVVFSMLPPTAPPRSSLASLRLLSYPSLSFLARPLPREEHEIELRDRCKSRG